MSKHKMKNNLFKNHDSNEFLKLLSYIFLIIKLLFVVYLYKNKIKNTKHGVDIVICLII